MASPSDASGVSDKHPVHHQHAGGGASVDQERFTRAWPSCSEPVRSAVPPLGGCQGTEGEPSLFSKEKCLSLQRDILLYEAKTGKEAALPPPVETWGYPRRRLMKYELKTNNSIAYSCHYHVVFYPKYRRKVLVGAMGERLRTIIKDKRANFADLNRGKTQAFRASRAAIGTIPSSIPRLEASHSLMITVCASRKSAPSSSRCIVPSKAHPKPVPSSTKRGNGTLSSPVR